MVRAAVNKPIIIVRRNRRGKQGHHGGAWKVAYADFVTAMMAFFLLLWLLGNQNKETLRGLADYFSPTPPMVGSAGNAAGGFQIGAGGHNRSRSSDQPQGRGIPAMDAQSAGTARGGTATLPDASLRVMAQELKLALSDTASEEQSRIETDGDALRITLMDSVRQPMFKSNTAVFNSYARHQLIILAQQISKAGLRLTIEGHTDGVGGDSEANWRLSGDRALATRTLLLNRGITPDRIAGVIARGASEPIYPGEPMRAENRRIVLILRGEAPSTPADATFKL